MPLTQDNKSASTLAQDSRTAVASLSQTSKSVTYLWGSDSYPWLLEAVWLYQNNGSALTLDIRH